MKFPRLLRILIGINVPMVIGALLFYLTVVIEKGDTPFVGPPDDPWLDLRAFFELIGIAYIFMGIQAIVATIIMEFLVLRKVRKLSLQVLAGALLGLLCGMTLTALEFALIGLATGLITGALMIRVYRKQSAAVKN